MPWDHWCLPGLALAVLLCAAAQAAPTPAPPVILAYGVVKIDDTSAARLKDGGWNLVLSYEKDLDTLQRHGLKAVMASEFLSPAALEDPAKREKLDAMIVRVKNRPALGMYWIVDEPNVISHITTEAA